MSDKEKTMEILQTALDNEDNSYIMNLTTEEISNMKDSVISDLYLDDDYKNEIIDKLEDYVYIDEIPHFIGGCYVRWINLQKPDDIKLTSGGTICDVELREGGTFIICKNNYGRKKCCFQIKMDENLIFRKLTNQEKVLLSVMNYLKKN